MDFFSNVHKGLLKHRNWIGYSNSIMTIENHIGLGKTKSNRRRRLHIHVAIGYIIMKTNVTASNSPNQHQFTEHLSTTFTQYYHESFTIRKRRICFRCIRKKFYESNTCGLCVWLKFFSTVIHFPRILCIVHPSMVSFSLSNIYL